MLTKINPIWSLGDGCLLRIQNAKRVTVNKKKDTCGIIQASNLLRDNKVIGLEDVVSQGWHQTVLVTDNPYIGVLVNGEIADDIQVSIEIDKIPMTLGQAKPMKTTTINGKTLLTFRLPRNKMKTASYVGVIAYSGIASQEVVGVYSLPGLKRSSRTIWSGLSLRYNALEVNNPKVKSTKVALTLK